MSYIYEYPHMAVTTDTALFRKSDDTYEILLVQRKNDPFAGKWALPGGYVNMDELLEDAALRELAEETNVKNVSVSYLGYFDAIDRDPRGRTLSHAFWGVSKESLDIVAGDDASSAQWFEVQMLPELAFDHAYIISQAIDQLNLDNPEV